MDKKIEDMQKLTNLTNEFMTRFIDCVDPRDYDNEREYFTQQCLTPPSIIASEIIDRLSGTFHIEREFLLNQYVNKVKLALKWIDHKNGR